MAATAPTVSCIMPTYNRRHFVPQAIRLFQRQDYPNRELLIVDDGTDCIQDLVPDDPQIRFLRLEQRHSLGAKRNIACENARGEIILHWDDDDWMAPWRIRYQAGELRREQADVCGLAQILFFDPANKRSWQYVYPNNGRAWVYGGTLCYDRSLWSRSPFPDVNVGEDNHFLWNSNAGRIAVLPDITFYVGLIHADNTSPKQTQEGPWTVYSSDKIQELLDEDLAFYLHRENGRLKGSVAQSNGRPERPASVEMMTVAREAHLLLPEFRAFGHGQSLPRMRYWELPFALFQARLSNTSSVLDCTINPVNLRERLESLYRHVLYRSWNPIQNGRFALPLGVPDEAFDRVICVNTLEHLLRPQREALVSSMAEKLRPGGLLILTSDYYFDGFWENPGLQRMGVVRSDREEVFNGWNRVGSRDWKELCDRHGLSPMAEIVDDPQETDPALYRNQYPYAHGCIGGVFCKGPRPNLPPGKKVVLALLTWNTCEISLESVHAYLEEARMLRRLGHEPFLCICDNGSTDGTADALRNAKSGIDIPLKLILNGENRGNSVARNQIIDYMLEVDADYLLLVDGDIEVVPFSSFAMLRYMEDHGRRLGCLGAHSAGQTPHRGHESRSWYKIDKSQVFTSNDVAWTQYGMFRREIFQDGIRFDETGPFNGAGWGFEDNDLAFQMDVSGYLIQSFSGMTYLHRSARSSVRVMRSLGIDADDLFSRRRKYVIDKWTSVPAINNGPLHYIRQMTRLV